MELSLYERIEIFGALGKRMKNFPADEFLELASASRNQNSWFTFENIRLAWNSVTEYLDEPTLKSWVSAYHFKELAPKNVGIVMAGNIPLVGFHDFLCVLISGNQVFAKLSSEDNILMKLLITWLKEISPEIDAKINVVERLNGVDAIIATGSNNTARYFEYYFKDIPHIIRKNRTSVAILDGEESDEDIRLLGEDIFTYYGLGCRNVSKLYVPQGFDFIKFIDGLESFSSVANHHKYNNNYDYNKAIYLVNGEHFLDNGFLLVKESTGLSSPVGVLFHENYTSKESVGKTLETSKDQIQCVVSRNGNYPGSQPFGKAQHPTLTDYADGVDTIDFLLKLN